MSRVKVRVAGQWVYADEAISSGGGGGTSAAPYARFATYRDIPGITILSQAASIFLSGGTLIYEPWVVTRTITIDQLSLVIKSGGNYGISAARLGVYNASSGWAAGTLVAQAENAAISGDGEKVVAVSIILEPGTYLAAAAVNGSADYFGYRGHVPGSLTGNSAAPYISSIETAFTYGALPTNGPAWTATTGFDTMRYVIMPRISAVGS